MKKKLFWAVIIPALLIFALAAWLVLARLDHMRASQSAVKLDTAYETNFVSWTGTDTHTLILRSGDALHTEWSLTGGTLDITVGIPGEKAIYTANRISARDSLAAFDLIIPTGGEYTITITAAHATGSLRAEKP